jgi:hypothetical protein
VGPPGAPPGKSKVKKRTKKSKRRDKKKMENLEKVMTEKYHQQIAKSTSAANFELTKKTITKLWDIVGELDGKKYEHSGQWHRCSGMREVRKIDPDNKRKPIWLQDIMRIGTCSDVYKNDKEIYGDEERKLIDLATQLSGCEVFILPNGDWVFLENPTRHEIINDNDDDYSQIALSCENGSAIEFSDGSKLYAIDDIVVPEWVVMTPADQMTPKQVLTIEDVDVRAVALRKIGLDKFLDGATIVDTDGNYHLYDLSHLFDDNSAVYLDMINPSSGDHHLEGVDNSCETVPQALKFRAGGIDWNPCQIDEMRIEGGNKEQYQQGDVLVQRCDGIPPDAPACKTRCLLADNNQRRHVASDGARLHGTEERQWVTADSEWIINHPEHGETRIPKGVWEIWGVVEVDHITGILRTVID